MTRYEYIAQPDYDKNIETPDEIAAKAELFQIKKNGICDHCHKSLENSDFILDHRTIFDKHYEDYKTDLVRRFFIYHKSCYIELPPPLKMGEIP
jgi:hypothetical protein